MAYKTVCKHMNNPKDCGKCKLEQYNYEVWKNIGKELRKDQKAIEIEINLAATALGFILGMAFVYYVFGCYHPLSA